MTSPQVARQYLTLFAEVRAERRSQPRTGSSGQAARFAAPEPPNVDLRHLRTLTDHTGILQHVCYTVPDRRHGYSSDDQARALIAVLRAHDLLGDETPLPLASTYLAHTFDDQTRRSRGPRTGRHSWADPQGNPDGWFWLDTAARHAACSS